MTLMKDERTKMLLTKGKKIYKRWTKILLNKEVQKRESNCKPVKRQPFVSLTSDEKGHSRNKIRYS